VNGMHQCAEFELHSQCDSQPVQLDQIWRDMVTMSKVKHKPSSISVMNMSCRISSCYVNMASASRLFAGHSRESTITQPQN